MDLWEHERELFKKGYKTVTGVDEAGRGPLAGPVYAAAVILPPGLVIEGLNDSKKLTEKKREALFDVIREKALAYAVAFATGREIDALNILNATYLAMNRAIAGLSVTPDICIIDGNRARGIETHNITLVGGDGKSANVAAASILAKVSRDRFMREMAEKYPGYGFEKHKGYGTREHYAAIRALGPTEIHRVSFLRKMH